VQGKHGCFQDQETPDKKLDIVCTQKNMKTFNENLNNSEEAMSIDVRDELSHKTRKIRITDETGSMASVRRSLLWTL
jgi:hypothetical protein